MSKKSKPFRQCSIWHVTCSEPFSSSVMDSVDVVAPTCREALSKAEKYFRWAWEGMKVEVREISRTSSSVQV